MTITELIKLLEELRSQVGDVNVYARCPFCSKNFCCDLAGLSQVSVILKEGHHH
jgi:hypothetical protein